MNYILQLNEFFVEGGSQERSHVMLHITEPSTPKEIKRGYFFALCEINNAETKYIAKIQDIIDEIENSYYEIPEPDNGQVLESVLEKVNQQNFSLIKSEVLLHCLVGVIRDTEIILAYYGSPQVLLFYLNRRGNYQKMSLIDTDQKSADDNLPPARQLFSQIVQGKMSPNDYLFVGTPHITDYFSHDRLQKIITTRPARQSADHLERVLSELKNGLSFGGLIVHLNKTETAPTTKKGRSSSKADSAQSLNIFFDTEKNTGKILASPFLPRVYEKIKSLLHLENKNEAGIASSKPQNEGDAPYATTEINSAHVFPHRPPASIKKSISVKEKLDALTEIFIYFLKNLLQGIIWLATTLWAILGGFLRGAVLLFFVATNIQHRRKAILENWSKQWRSYRGNFQLLPTPRKVMIISSVILLVALVVSIFFLFLNQKQAQEKRFFQETFQLINNKKDAAESALIYHNETAALNELLSAEELFSQLPCHTKEQKNVCQNLNKQLEDISIKIKKITTVETNLIADWGGLMPSGAVSGMIKIKNKIIGFGSSTSTLVAYDTLVKSNRILPANDIITTGFTAAAVPKENDYAILVYNKNKLARFDPLTNFLKKIEVAYPAENVEIDAVIIYNRRLYSVDKAHNKIYKHEAIKNGFGLGKEWTGDAVADLKNGISIAIDGDVFILNSDGKINKFSNGLIQPFAIQGLLPALESGNKIWTYLDLNYIYILDSKNKRLVILEKDGRFKMQITAKEFNDPIDMLIDENGKIAYILDGSRLFQITLPL